MGKTNIEWSDYVLNPIVGCTKISAGCKNCYAEKMAWRLKCMGIPKYQDVVDKNGWTGKIGVDMGVFNKLPKKPCRVFINSMGDLWHKSISINKISAVLGKVYKFPQHTFLVLTKRPDRMKSYYDFIDPSRVTPRTTMEEMMYSWPAPNLWLGVTVEHPGHLDRVETLLQIPAAVRFVSVEPMLGPITAKHWYSTHNWHNWITGETGIGRTTDNFKSHWQTGKHIDWAVAGPETGPRARPCKPEWIESLYEQCRAAGVPFFDKRPNFLAREFPK